MILLDAYNRWAYVLRVFLFADGEDYHGELLGLAAVGLLLLRELDQLPLAVADAGAADLPASRL